MKYKSFNLCDIPTSLDLKITERLANYSVAIARMQNGKPQSFQPLGSGTFVQKNNKFGILTAHHCLHAVKPKVKLGIQNGDTLVLALALRGGRSVVIKSHELREIELTSPDGDKYGEYGPDLTFIDIPDGPQLSTLKAVSSFWNLDREPHVIEKEFVSSNLLACSGFPEADCRTELTDKAVFRKIKFMSFINAISKERIETQDLWDYIRSSINYEFSSDLPKTFEGLSGGGIWSVRIKCEEKLAKWDVIDFALVGVVFFQTELKNKRRNLRGHFIKSIYSTAWKQHT